MPLATPVQIPDASGGLVNLSDPSIERLISAGEANLKGLRVVQDKVELKQHVRHTQKEYQKAIDLYRQQRMSLAEEELKKVSDLMADYKSTERVLKTIHKKAHARLRRQVHRKRLLEDPKMVNELAFEAEELEAKTEVLENDSYTSAVRGKLTRLMRVVDRLEQERMRVSPKQTKQLKIQRQFDQIGQKAENYDKEVYRLTQSNNYQDAERKLFDFQQAMINDLSKLQQNMTSAAK